MTTVEVVAGRIETGALKQDTVFRLKGRTNYGSTITVPAGTMIVAVRHTGRDPQWGDEYPQSIDTVIEYTV